MIPKAEKLVNWPCFTFSLNEQDQKILILFGRFKKQENLCLLSVFECP